MNLKEYSDYVIATRENRKAQAMSVLSNATNDSDSVGN